MNIHYYLYILFKLSKFILGLFIFKIVFVALKLIFVFINFVFLVKPNYYLLFLRFVKFFDWWVNNLVISYNQNIKNLRYI